MGEVALDLVDGGIIIKEGAYTIGGGGDIPNLDNVYIISQTDAGTRTANTITVQDGVAASIAVTLNGVNISGGNPVNLGSSGNLTLTWQRFH